jgi:hypothetical protein
MSLPRVCLLPMVVIGFVAFRATAEAPKSQAAVLTTVCKPAAHCDVDGTLTLRAAEDPTVAIGRPVSDGIAALTAEDRAGVWELELAADGFWMPRQRLLPHMQTIQVWRATRLAGRFTTLGTAELPASFEIFLHSPFGTGGVTIAEGTRIDCPIAGDGSWACVVPAVPLDLTFRVRGFTPHYQWGVKLQPAATKNVGRVALRRGGSLVAWLDRKTLGQLKTPARARVMRAAMLIPSPIAQKLSQPVAEGTFNDRGMVQLTPLPGGTYSLEVIAPGFATATVPQIVVYEGKESTLRHPVRLDPALSLRFVVDPARDADAKPWRIGVSRAAELTGQNAFVTEGETDDSGSFAVDGQAPGRYRFWLKDSSGNRFAGRSFAVHTEADAFIRVDVGALPLNGRVTMGNHGVSATLEFTSRTRGENIRTTSGASGEFEVVLPRLGEWEVVVREDSEGIRAFRKVTVEAESPIEIELPETELAGWVIGADGTRVPTAEVAVVTEAGLLERNADATGAFRLRGLTPGPTRITARNLKTGEFSRVVAIDLKEDTPTEGVQLELDGLRRLRGSLFCNGQPVIGAGLTGYGLTGGMARMAQAVSGLEGEFELSFPTTAPTIMLIVASPGRTLQAYTVSPADDPIRLELAPAGGTIRLSRPEKATRPLLVYNGTDIPMHHLAEWARAHGTSLAGFDFEVPALAPGPYRFCADVGEARICREGLLARGGALTQAID